MQEAYKELLSKLAKAKYIADTVKPLPISREDRYFSVPLSDTQLDICHREYQEDSWYVNQHEEDLEWEPQQQRQKEWKKTGRTTFTEQEGVYFKQQNNDTKPRKEAIFTPEQLKAMQIMLRSNIISGTSPDLANLHMAPIPVASCTQNK